MAAPLDASFHYVWDVCILYFEREHHPLTHPHTHVQKHNEWGSRFSAAPALSNKQRKIKKKSKHIYHAQNGKWKMAFGFYFWRLRVAPRKVAKLQRQLKSGQCTWLGFYVFFLPFSAAKCKIGSSHVRMRSVEPRRLWRGRQFPIHVPVKLKILQILQLFRNRVCACVWDVSFPNQLLSDVLVLGDGGDGASSVNSMRRHLMDTSMPPVKG